MKINRFFSVLRLLMLLLLVAPICIQAQSSIYQDAKEMATFLKTTQPPEVRFYFAPGSNGRGVVTDFDSIDLKNVKRFIIPKFGGWSFAIDQGQAGDQMRFRLNDTLIVLNQDPELQQVYFEYADYTMRLVAQYPDTAMTVFDPLQQHSGSPLVVQTKDQIIHAISTLGAHTAFEQISEPDFQFRYPDIFKAYASNPYISRYVYRSPYLNTDLGTRLYSIEELTKSMDFPTFYKKQYPWQGYLDGDSTVSFNVGVSIQDVSTSYRQQIVTSQDELVEASVQINNTGRRRGALDAKTIAVGLSDFIAQRAQEELNLTFFHRFKKNLDRPSELTALFPETKELLYQFEISNYKTLLAHARGSFTTDLKNLGVNFPKILDLKKYRELKNDPNVFNLSLIYRIADLAYKEQPIETILLASHQLLLQRQTDLDRSINLAIADTIVVQKGNRISQAESKEQQQLKQYLNLYLESLKKNSDDLEQGLNDGINSLNANMENFDGNNLYWESMPVFKQALKGLNEARSLLRANQPNLSGIQYQNRILEEATPYEHYKNVINANLSGRAYYGYLIDDPRVEDYDVFFKPDPKVKAEYIARGIEETRNLLDQGYEGQLAILREELQEQFEIENAELTKIQNLFSYSIEQNSCANQIYSEVNHLEAAIQSEIAFWEQVTELDQRDHYIAGLYFLKALMKKDIYIDVFKTLGEEIDFGGRTFEQIVEEDYQNTLAQDFYAVAEIAEDHLDSIAVDFENQVQGLVEAYGSLQMDEGIYRDLRAVDAVPDELKALEAERNQIEQSFVQESVRLENSLEIRLEEDPEVQDIRNQLISLNEKIREIEDPVEKQNINSQIDSINQLFNEVIERIEIDVVQKLEALEIEKASALEALQSQMDSIANLPGNALPITTSSSSVKKPIQSFYQLNDNVHYESLQLVKSQDLRQKGGFAEDTDRMSQLFVARKNQIDSLQLYAKQLNRYLDTLAGQYCPQLVQAKENADALKMGLELSTHLFFAFRNYEHTYDTLYYTDTVRVTVTTTQLDSLTGFTNSYTSDTLKIIKKPIEGTTDPVLTARWLTRKEFNSMRKNKVQWDFFLGLLYQRMRSVKNAPKFSPEGIALLTTKFFQIANEVELTRRDLRRKKSITPDHIGFKDYYPIIRSTVDLFNTVITTRAIDTSSLTQVYPQLKYIPRISDEALSLYENIYIKDYADAVLNAMELLKLLQTDQLNKKGARAINAVLTYGTFMANMIDAQTSEQVKAILQSTTLPPGSSRIKREVVSNFTINSYLGVTAGRDRLLDAPVDLEANSFGAALSLPIGFTYSFSPKFIKNRSSFSVHVPLLDLGAITAFRQSPDNTQYNVDDLPDFTWRNLLSPGAFAVYNFANGPLSVGVGGQYGPQLREIQPITGEALMLNSWRFPMVFFNVDVPLLNLYTGPRKILIE